MSTYIHGTEPSEQERLAELNRITNAAFVQYLHIVPGLDVLEVGSGLGILAAAVADADEDVHVVALEQSRAQIAAAVSHSRVRHVQGDAHALEFPDATFDVVYARYLLEHVADPERVLREMRRVTKPGGRVAVCENDVSLLRLDPPCPAFDRAWEQFMAHQAQLGGDSRIGHRLFRLFRSAGFSNIELSIQPEVHWHGSPGFVAWMQNLVGNLESARRGLTERGSITDAEFKAALAELEALKRHTDASSVFTWNRATARR